MSGKALVFATEQDAADAAKTLTSALGHRAHGQAGGGIYVPAHLVPEDVYSADGTSVAIDDDAEGAGLIAAEVDGTIVGLDLSTAGAAPVKQSSIEAVVVDVAVETTTLQRDLVSLDAVVAESEIVKIDPIDIGPAPVEKVQP